MVAKAGIKAQFSKILRRKLDLQLFRQMNSTVQSTKGFETKE